MDRNKRLKAYIEILKGIHEEMNSNVSTSAIANMAWEGEQIATIIKEVFSDIENDC